VNHEITEYRKLFLSTLYLSTFTFGGGYVIVSLMRKKFVDEYHWIDEKEMIDLTAIAQSAPGSIAVNASILVGYRVAGIPGALLTICGTILPPLVILAVISLFYQAFERNPFVSAALKGMQAGVSAVIFDVVISMGSDVVKEKNLLSVILMGAVFAASYFFNVNIILIIVLCAALGAVSTVYRSRKENAK
jgi:chromate transporter